jgi:hypothetical protein
VTEIEATASMVDVSLKVGTVFEAGVSDGTLALLIRNDSTAPAVTTKALKASGMAFLTSGDFASVMVASATVKLNDTGINFDATMGGTNRTLNVDGVMGTLDMASGVQSVSLVGLNAEFAGFVQVSGDFGFRKSVVGTVTEIEATASMVDVSLKVGTVFEAGVSDGTLALLIRNDSTTPAVTTKALKASGMAFLTAGDFASVTVASATVKLNDTGINFDAMTGGTNRTLNVDGVMGTLDMASGVQSVSLVGLNAEFAGFVQVSGDRQHG